jgi:amino acid transporter
MTSASPSIPASPPAAPSLERNAVGWSGVVFQCITHMAPAVATAASIGAATVFAGAISPLAVLFAMIAVLFTAYSLGELARHLPSAGGMYTYVGRGLGSFFGWLMGWAFTLAEPLGAPLLFGGFGFFGAIFVATYLGVELTQMWAILAIACGLLTWWLLYSGISFSTRAGVVLGTIEIVIFLGIAILLVINAGSDNTVSVFIPGEDGITPALQGMVFCVLAFIGFEAAAPLGEEAKDPKRTIPRAAVLSALAVGAFYVFNMYAATVYFGPDRMATEFLGYNGGDPWGGMAEEVLPVIGGFAVLVAILNSCLANASAASTAATRSVFNMGRGGLLPRFFGAVHPTRQTPVNAIHVQMILGLALVLILGFVLTTDPFPAGLNVYVFLGTLLSLLFAGMYMAVNLACIGYFLREGRAHFNPIKHLLIPILGFITMIPALLFVIGGVTIPIIGLEVPSLGGDLVVVAPIAGVWMLIGIVLYFVIRAIRPQAIKDLAAVYGETDTLPDPAPPAPAD